MNGHGMLFGGEYAVGPDKEGFLAEAGAIFFGGGMNLSVLPEGQDGVRCTLISRRNIEEKENRAVLDAVTRVAENNGYTLRNEEEAAGGDTIRYTNHYNPAHKA